MFYEKSTETIRLCPENYLLAYKRNLPEGDWRWRSAPDAAVVENGIMQEQLQVMIDWAWEHCPLERETSDFLAEVLEKYLKEKDYPKAR